MLPSGGAQEDPVDFDPVWYLNTYPDVRLTGVDPLEHFLTWGRAEGRAGGPSQALELDHMLWRGFDDIALPQLRRLLSNGPARERALAGWVLARWERDRKNRKAAYKAIMTFHRLADEGCRAIPHPGPFLLGIQLCLACGDEEGAARILEDGMARFGGHPELDLAAMFCDNARGAEDWELSAHLSRLYRSHGLPPVELREGRGTRFNRLRAATWSETDLPDPPLVSVIVPVFNGAPGLSHALGGLARQSWRNLEVLVVDDGSTDNSAEIARDWVARDERFHLISLEQNQGAYPARNVGLSRARGAFITVHDADDWSHPSKIEYQAMALIEDPEIKASISHWVRAGNALQMTRWRMEEGWIYRNVSSLMIRAELRDSLGYWDRVRVDADTEYYYRIISAHGHAAIREVLPGVPLAFGRTLPRSLTQQSDTHLRTALHGLRRSYFEAARYWHEQAATPEELYLPQHPDRRPFRVPEKIALGDPEGPASAYDILSASDHFDRRWYYLAHPDVLRADLSPVSHYLAGGAREGRDPGPLFSTSGYRMAQGLAREAVPLLHWEEEGRAAGADPLPSFPGALDGTVDARPRPLVFAHMSGDRLFGAERSLINVVEAMHRRGDCPVVVVPGVQNPNYLEQLVPHCAAVEVLPQIWRHMSRPPPAETVEAIRGLIRKHQASQVYVNTLVLDAPLLAARAEGCECVVHVRELPAEDTVLCRNIGAEPEELRLLLLEQADRFVANSGRVAGWLDCPDRVTIRPNAVEESLFELPFAPQEELKVALISSNVTKKGVADFINVARIVEQDGRRMRFLLIGPPTEDLHLLRPWPENVDFRDYAASPAEAVGQADLVMSLSKFAESFGRTVLEAMAAGRPVVCYDRGVPPSLVESGKTGFVVPADDIQAAANAVMALDAARGKLAEMSGQARLHARQLQDLAFQD